MEKKLTQKQYLLLISDIEKAINYLKTHKWVKDTEFVVNINQEVTSACAVGAVRGGVYNGKLKVNRATFYNFGTNQSAEVNHSYGGEIESYETRYENVLTVFDAAVVLRTKGNALDVVEYNDGIAKRKRDLLTLFERGKNLVIGGKFVISAGIVQPSAELQGQLDKLILFQTTII